MVLAADYLAAQQCLYKVELADKNYEKAVQHALVLMSAMGAQPGDIAAVSSLPFRTGVETFEIWRLDQLELRAESESVSPALFAFSLATLSKYDEALYYLIKGHENRFSMTAFALLDPVFIPIRHQSRFLELANDMGIDVLTGL
jgi:hypothetical protein